MIKEAIGFGDTIDEAKEKAISELNASDFDDIQFEILTMPKKKTLGLFGGSKAEVRVFIEIPDKKVKTAKKNAPKKAEKPIKKTEDKPVKKTLVQAAVPTARQAEPTQKHTVSEYGEAIDSSLIPADSEAGRAVAYIKNILDKLNCGEIKITVQSNENGSLISLDGDDLSIIIGRRGETLDSLQYLAGLAANNGGGHYKIALNIGNYREKREETLKNLAARISAQVLKTGKNRTLEPMNPYERRIIHTAIQEIEGVVSTSFGEGVGRRIVISPEGAEVRPPRYSNDRSSRGHDRGRNSKPRRQSSSRVVANTNREPKKDSDTPLYGKIN